MSSIPAASILADGISRLHFTSSLRGNHITQQAVGVRAVLTGVSVHGQLLGDIEDQFVHVGRGCDLALAHTEVRSGEKLGTRVVVKGLIGFRLERRDVSLGGEVFRGIAEYAGSGQSSLSLRP